MGLESPETLAGDVLPESPLGFMAPFLTVFSCHMLLSTIIKGQFLLGDPQGNNENIHCSSTGIPLLSLLPS